MEIVKTEFEGVCVIKPRIHSDDRGYFYESYSRKCLDIDFLQDNHSFTSKKNTFRGFHFQKKPYSQITCVRVVSGEIIDYVVDLRKESPTYGKYISNVLSAENHQQVLIPQGYAHGFLTLTNNVTVLYKMSDYYNKASEMFLNYRGIINNLERQSGEFKINRIDDNAPLLEQLDHGF